MPSNKGTSRKGKPGKNERAVGMGKALQRAQGHKHKPRADGKSKHRGEGGGMEMQVGVESIGLQEDPLNLKTKSILELNDLDDFLIQAEMANREFETEREGLVVLDETGQVYKPTTVKWSDQDKTDFVFTELSVPRRPAWDAHTTPQELAQIEERSFLAWRRAIAIREEEMARKNSSSAVSAVTPFEKNLEVWRQLWRVLERSSCLLQLVDARNPLFYLSDDLKAYAESLGKPMMVLLNKSDYLSRKQREVWYKYLTERGWFVVFFSAVKEQQKLDDAAYKLRREEEERMADPRLAPEKQDEREEADEVENESGDEKETEQGEHKEAGENLREGETAATKEPEEPALNVESTDGMGVDVPLTRKQLLDTMLAFARQQNCQPDERYGNRIQFGMVGFPNVGKSSVINVLVGSSKHAHGIVRVAVASQPGKTKHFQTLLLPEDTGLHDKMMLCDCPGLVFPSFVSNTADLIAAGVYPIAQMRDHWPVTRLICQRIPREIINANYGIQLPTLTAFELREAGLTDQPPPTAEELLGTYCVARGLLAASSGVPDYPRAARVIIKDYADGRLLYCHSPPHLLQQGGEELQEFYRETIGTALLNTRKLREKLLRRQLEQERQHQAVDGQQQEHQQGENPTSKPSPDEEAWMDEDILEMLGGGPSGSSQNHTKTAGGKTGRKWGKKDRKNRNKDPYGCHSTPDEQMLSEHAGGVVVNAGKHGRKGYTRPVSYAGPRAAAALQPVASK